VCCAGLAVVLDVRLGGFRRVMHGVLMMAMCQMRVVPSGFVIALFVMLGGFLMVPCGVLVMFCCLVMMFCCLF
jgi:hypothetical protein